MSEIKFSVNQTVLLHNKEGKVVSIANVHGWTRNTVWVDGIAFSAITGKRVKAKSTTHEYNKNIVDIYSHERPHVPTKEIYDHITHCEHEREIVDDIVEINLNDYEKETELSELIGDLQRVADHAVAPPRFTYSNDILNIFQPTKESNTQLFIRLYVEPEFNRQQKEKEESERLSEIATLEARLKELKK